MIDSSISDDQIYDILESRLKLFTALWFSSLTDAHYNLQYTAILVEIFKTKALVDFLSQCLKKS